MDANAIDKVSKHVAQRFPGLKGSRPQVQPYAGSQFLLIFKGKSQTADGKTIQQTVRVVAASDGKIIKLTASR